MYSVYHSQPIFELVAAIHMADSNGETAETVVPPIQSHDVVDLADVCGYTDEWPTIDEVAASYSTPSKRHRLRDKQSQSVTLSFS